MATGKGPDPRRRKTPHVHATHFKVANNGKESGHKAGDMYGCYTHRTHASQPCVEAITDGALKCPDCAANREPIWKGYVPIWDRDWCLRYALISEDIFESVDAIANRATVVLSRAKNPISPLIVREDVTFLRPLPERAPWNADVDMLSICLTLWKHDELSRWYGKHPEARRTVNAKALAEEVAKPPKTPLQRYGEKQARADAEATDLEGDIVKTVNRMKAAPSANGAFKGPGKPR